MNLYIIGLKKRTLFIKMSEFKSYVTNIEYNYKKLLFLKIFDLIFKLLYHFFSKINFKN